ncbi:hypothetical protein Q5O14_16450 [Eubacteriaceae bacterium ES2]|nr:hypothetical protein Q5O14_16450 [Eubacteriaceae bacterium ES2]
MSDSKKELNQEKQNKNNKKLFRYLVCSAFVLIIFPIFLDFVVFGNSIPSSLTNGEWSAFLGSYFGGALGGIGTLLAVYFTTKETRKIQTDTQEQIAHNRALTEKKERKEFADEIAKTVSIYISSIRLFFDKRHSFITKKNKIDQLNKEISQDKKMNFSGNFSIYDDKYKVIKKLENDINNLNFDRSYSVEKYYLLQIFLKNIELAKDLLEDLDKVHTSSLDSKISKKDFGGLSNALINSTMSFCQNYVENETDHSKT